MSDDLDLIGHNSTSRSDDRLHYLVQRIERLEAEKKALTSDIKGVYNEAKASGYDSATIRKVVVYRRKDANERGLEQALFDTYLHALGILD